jgi:hypothetical protein
MRACFRFLSTLATSCWLASTVFAQTDSLAFSSQPGTSAAQAESGRILIGTVPGYRRVDGEDNARFYELYRKLAPHAVDGSPMLTQDEFAATIAGWTRLKVLTLPLAQGFREEEVLIPSHLGGDIGLPLNAGNFAEQEAGDLLVARTNADGFFVVEAVLCREGQDYAACASAYQSGLFDAASGMKIGVDGQVAPTSDRIDVNSYKVIEEPAPECVSALIEDRMRAGPKVMDIIPTTDEKELYLGCDAVETTFWASR